MLKGFIIKFFLSKIYFCLLNVVLFLYKINFLKTYSFKKNNIISIGNLSIGGSGKTPMVIALSKVLNDLNVSHAVVSRGYKKTSSGEVVVSDGLNIIKDYKKSGDEPFLLASALRGVPVVVGNKVRAIRRVNKFKKYKTILIDDGYQTFKIQRDLYILLLDLSRDARDYKLLPLGFLREPLSAISRADVVVFTKEPRGSSKKLKCYLKSCVDLNRQLLLETQAVYSLLEHKKNSFIKINHIINNPTLCFSGIASPKPFIKTAKKMFSNIVENFVFPDHCDYGSKEMLKIKSVLNKKNISSVVTTMKDFIKIRSLLPGFSVFVIDVKYDIVNVDLLIKKIRALKN